MKLFGTLQVTIGTKNPVYGPYLDSWLLTCKYHFFTAWAFNFSWWKTIYYSLQNVFFFSFKTTLWLSWNFLHQLSTLATLVISGFFFFFCYLILVSSGHLSFSRSLMVHTNVLQPLVIKDITRHFQVSLLRRDSRRKLLKCLFNCRSMCVIDILF